MTTKYYNNHTLYLRTFGPINPEQVLKWGEECCKLMSEKLGRKITSDFQYNIVHNQDGEYQNHCYLWCSNIELFHVLGGANPDGSERVELITKSKKKDDEDYELMLKDLKSGNYNGLVNMAKKDSWADLYGDDEETTPEKKYLEPLIKFPTYKYTTEQKRKILDDLERAIPADTSPDVKSPNSASPTPLSSPSGSVSPSTVKDVKTDSILKIETEKKIEIPDEGKINPVKAFVNDLDTKKNLSQSTLCCYDLDPSITPEDLRSIFSRYSSMNASDSGGFNQQKNKNSRKSPKKQCGYPEVRITSKRMGIINFRPGTRDAQFALQMTKVFRFAKTPTSEKKFTIVFRHQKEMNPDSNGSGNFTPKEKFAGRGRSVSIDRENY